MQKRTKLTNSSDETMISSLISGDNVYTVPYFQRPYKWKTDNINQLNSDISDIISSEGDPHFLGAIIVHGRKSNPSDPNLFDIIDGQQRITTLVLYLCAIVRNLCLLGEYEEAKNLFLKFLVIPRDTKISSNIKLHPCKEDMQQINTVYAELMSDRKFVKLLGGFNISYLPRGGKEKGRLSLNFLHIKRHLKKECDLEGIQRIREIYTAILENISVVQIDIWDPTNGPKIFDGLNSRQEPMTIGDLVRNEVFQKVSELEVSVIEEIDNSSWQPFYQKFKQDKKDTFDSYFFPFGLIQDPNLKKSEVFSFLRDQWRVMPSPEEIIFKLSEYQDAFLDLVNGSNYQKHEKDTNTAFRNFFIFKAPSSTYPFLVQLSNAMKNETILKKDGLEVLSIIESFLVRRAVCGHEPTGLHAVFKRLWKDCNGQPTALLVKDAISSHKTVVWPDNIHFQDAIKTRDLYNTGIIAFLIFQFEVSLKGDKQETKPWIEHVLPESPSPEWKENFTDKEHKSLKDTLANLIPLSSEMNRSIGNKAYSLKRKKFLEDSSFKTAREFAKQYHTWTPKDLSNRAEELAKWAVNQWNY